ncbi:DUF4870 domain-containing protein [Candidatus Woesearchaeota archaeon]|nr:DUF4870 domain-containing protein [Candidatus Woesearchaeota archaeon]
MKKDKKKEDKKTAKKETKEKGAASDTKICAVLTYLIVGIIWYFVDEKMKKDNFVRYHTKQALGYWGLAIAVSIVSNIIAFIPFLGWAIATLLNLVLLVLFIIGIYYSATGKTKPLPVIGAFAERIFTF